MPFVRPTRLRSGALLQSGIPKQAKSLPEPFNGVVRGVVMATYRVDADDHPLVPLGIAPTSIWCDVLAVGNFQGGSRYFFLPGCQVCQPFGGIHKGSIFVPRATTRLLGGKPLSSVTPQDVNQMDGDWVLVQFLDGRTNQPVITGTLPHPSRDVGNSPDLPSGHRQQLRLVDGDPFFFLKNGSFFGVTSQGNFQVDTTRGTGNGLNASGGDAVGSVGQGSHIWNLAATASRATAFGSAGSEILRESLSSSGYILDTLSLPLSFQLTSAVGNGLRVSGGGAQASMILGDGSVHAAISEKLLAWWDGVIKPYLDSHVHSLTGPIPGATGPSAVPSPQFDPSVASNKLSLPGN